MSQRSVVEFNHDYSHRIEDDEPIFVDLLAQALASGSDENWAMLRTFGVTRIVQVHPSTDRRVVLKVAGQDVEYPFGCT